MALSFLENGKKVLINKTTDTNQMKKQKGTYCTLYNAGKLEDNEDYNTYLFNLENNFLVVDIDSEEGFNYVNELFNKYNIDSNILKKTRSISNINKINKYKYHIYFNNNLDIKNNKLMSGLDLLTKGLLFEDSAQFDDKLRFQELPNMEKELYNDLLLFENIKKEDIKPIEKKDRGDFLAKVPNKKDNNDIYKILDNLNIKRFDNYNDWLYLHMIFINEKLDLDILKSYCKKSSKYNEEANNKIIKHIKPNKGLTIKTMYYWLKKDNINEFNNLVQFNSLFFDSSLINNKDIAELYYNMNPNQFIYNKNLGWFVYNDNNILLEYGQNPPSLLLNDIANRTHDWLNSLKNSINLSDDAKTEKFKMISKAYTKIGMATFIKGCIDFLKNLYNVEKLEDKIDSNKNVVAFENILYDLDIGNFRKIKYDDYIIKNTKYNINIESNKDIRNKINDLLFSIFENNDVINFWKISTALSIFGKSFESLYIHTGSGRNGKGVLSTLLKSMLGDYFLTTDNTFLTTIFKSGQANSTLAQSKGIRFLLVSEPDNGTKDCLLNIDFVKSMTGGDEISARDLYAKATTFKPFFSLLLQCNQKPKLSKIDKAMEERLKIINYPFTFVDNPKNPEERQKDNNLKDLITDNEFINEFILMLLEIANENKNIKFVELPEEVKQQNKEYIEDNNYILTFINENYEITNNIKDKIKSSDLLNAYNSYSDNKIDSNKLKQMMQYNRFKFLRNKEGSFYTNLKLKIDEDEDKNDFCDLDM